MWETSVKGKNRAANQWSVKPPAQVEAGFGEGRDCRGPRIALYSHDTQGLGHIRRNLLIAAALCQGGTTPIILMLSGVREAAAFAMPAGVDCLTLPSLGKGADGKYFPRSLGVPTADLISVRSAAIAAALRAFIPDVLIVDKVPLGAFDELEPGLKWLRAHGRTRLVLGLREILDDPNTVRREWAQGRYDSAIRRYYDRVWIYGDQRVYDPVREYRLPSHIAEMVRYTGYLNPRDVNGTDLASELNGEQGVLAGLDLPPGPLVLCLVGGGRDGLPLAEAFLGADLPWGANGVVVTGPLMPAKARATLKSLAVDRRRVRILEFITDPGPLLSRADRVIAMGGYNTICEILAFGAPALIVPRVEPRTEQLVRAACFADLGMVDMLHPQNLTPRALSDWLAHPNGHLVPAQGRVDFDGVMRLPDLLDDVLAVGQRDKEPTHAAG